MQVTTNATLVYSGILTNLEFDNGTNIHFSGVSVGQTVKVRADLDTSLTNVLTGDATGSGNPTIAVTVTNLQQAIITNHVYWTNTVDLTNSQGVAVDLNLREADYQASGVVTFTGLTHKSTTNYQSVVITVYNTGATGGILAPPNCHTNGLLPYVVTNGGISKVLFEYHPLYNYTNMLVYPLF